MANWGSKYMNFFNGNQSNSGSSWWLGPQSNKETQRRCDAVACKWQGAKSQARWWNSSVLFFQNSCIILSHILLKVVCFGVWRLPKYFAVPNSVLVHVPIFSMKFFVQSQVKGFHPCVLHVGVVLKLHYGDHLITTKCNSYPSLNHLNIICSKLIASCHLGKNPDIAPPKELCKRCSDW